MPLHAICHRTIGAAVLVALAACSSTTLVSERTGPSTLESPLQRVLVIGVSDDVAQRIRFERAFASELGRQAAIDATGATALVEPEKSLDYELLRTALAQQPVDGILLIRKLGERADVREVQQGGIPEVDMSAYDDFHGRYLRTIASSSDEHVTRKVRAEITLLRSGDYEEVWTGATDTTDPRDLDRIAGELAAVVVERLRAHRLL